MIENLNLKSAMNYKKLPKTASELSQITKNSSGKGDSWEKLSPKNSELTRKKSIFMTPQIYIGTLKNFLKKMEKELARLRKKHGVTEEMVDSVSCENYNSGENID